MAEKIELPAETLDNLREINQTLDALDEFLTKVSVTGIDVTAKKEVSRELRRKVKGIRDGFYPGQIL